MIKDLINRLTDEDGWFERGVFVRLHWSDCPEFCADNATTAPWGAEFMPCPRHHGFEGADGCHVCGGEGEIPVERESGYSCFNNPIALIKYFETRGGGEGERVVIFRGNEVGTGPDSEPLAIPTEIITWTTYEELRAALND
jgi:hypothetical protein